LNFIYFADQHASMKVQSNGDGW